MMSRMQVLKKHFTDCLKTEGFPEKIVISWSYALRYFIRWCDKQGINDPRQFDRSILEQYREYLSSYRNKNGYGLTGRTRHNRLVCVMVFSHWLLVYHGVKGHNFSNLNWAYIQQGCYQLFFLG